MPPSRRTDDQANHAGSIEARHSICADVCTAGVADWMHYGRSGTGVALQLDTAMLSEIEQFTLCKVLYDGTEQIRWITPIVQLVDNFLERSLEGIRDTEVEQLLKVSAASMLYSFLRLAAPQMKDGAFECFCQH